MPGFDRRTAQRYVLGDLGLEINGVWHDTIDISKRSVAIVAQQGVDYAAPRVQARFVSGGVAELNREVLTLHVIGLRRSRVILDYTVADKDWEALLRQHDVNDEQIVNNAFG
ncbi:MAG: hypothetical protein GC190_19480 [Alphaproteobacteria bacterium]|nr:hypothetical protein [Alphaproteobacteria bacterium]